PRPGGNPHHDAAFLVCARERESGGNYGAVNPAGPYLGAYQFLQATWDSAANHAGRTSLIGVPPNTASEYDQDDIAWDLYQWQGAAPWGGLCAELGRARPRRQPRAPEVLVGPARPPRRPPDGP